ncbi:MAG: hypothetical protein ACTHMP_25825, partial [Thermomicrobiales bacterium]
VRVRRATNIPQPSGTTTAYVAGLWEEDLGVVWRSLCPFAGHIIAQRDTALTVTYLHADQVGSVSAVQFYRSNVASHRFPADWPFR